MDIKQTIRELGIDGHHLPHGTDKVSVHSYELVYNDELRQWQDSPVSLLEIGVQGGGCMLLWQRIFKDPGAKLFFVDNRDQVPPFSEGGPRF